MTAQLVNRPSRTGSSPLHVAVLAEQQEAVRLILQVRACLLTLPQPCQSGGGRPRA